MVVVFSIRGIDTYRFRSLRCEFAKKIMTSLPLFPRRMRRFWLMHSSPRPLDFASAMPAMKASLDARMSSWNCRQSFQFSKV